jgi:hypothetical protein
MSESGGEAAVAVAASATYASSELVAEQLSSVAVAGDGGGSRTYSAPAPAQMDRVESNAGSMCVMFDDEEDEW